MNGEKVQLQTRTAIIQCGYNVVILVLSHLVTVIVDPFKYL